MAAWLWCSWLPTPVPTARSHCAPCRTLGPGRARGRTPRRRASEAVLSGERLRARGLRPWVGGRLLLRGDGVSRGREPVAGDPPRAASRRARRLHRDRAVPLSGRRARVRVERRRPRFPPPVARRSDAGERPHHGGRPGESARLRHRQGAVDEPQGHAQRLRQHRLPVPRADRERRRDGRHRRLLGRGRDALRDAARRAAVQRARHAAPRARNHRAAAGAAARRHLPGGPAGGRGQAARAHPGRSLSERRGYPARSRARAGRRRHRGAERRLARPRRR